MGEIFAVTAFVILLATTMSFYGILVENVGLSIAIVTVVLAPYAVYKFFEMLAWLLRERCKRLEFSRQQIEQKRQESMRLAGEIRAARCAQIATITNLVARSRKLASHLPGLTTQADQAANRAEVLFDQRKYNQFWESMEEATACLCEYQNIIGQIHNNRLEYGRVTIKKLKPEAPDFNLTDFVFPDTRATSNRIMALFSKADGDASYAQLYAQRQINKTLENGLKSLGQTIFSVGGMIREQLSELQNAFTDRIESHRDETRKTNAKLDDILLSAEEGSGQAQQFHKELMEELHRRRNQNT